MKNVNKINTFIRDGGKLIPYSDDRAHKILCPVCGCVSFDDNYVCSICGWEFDGVYFDNERVPVNFGMSQKKWRKRFISRCSKNIQGAYKNLIRVSKNKYRLFDLEYIVSNPGLYREFYSQNWWDDDTKEFLSEVGVL